MDDGYKLVVGVPSVEDYCSLVLSRCTGLYRDGFLNQAMGWQFRVVQAASTFCKDDPFKLRPAAGSPEEVYLVVFR